LHDKNYPPQKIVALFCKIDYFLYQSARTIPQPNKGCFFVYNSNGYKSGIGASLLGMTLSGNMGDKNLFDETSRKIIGFPACDSQEWGKNYFPKKFVTFLYLVRLNC
jgi:hypothetical protein